MSFASSPFGSGLGFGLPAPSEEARAALSSSRMIDGKAKRYVIADDGGFASMDDTAQRVLCLVAYAPAPGPLIFDRELRTTEQGIRSQLAPLTSGQEPAIDLLEVLSIDDGKQTVHTKIRYKNLLTGTTTATAVST